MRINVLGIYLVDYRTIKNNTIKKLYIENKELENLSRKIKTPSQNRLPLFDSLSENIFSTSTRFKIEELHENDYLYRLLTKSITSDTKVFSTNSLRYDYGHKTAYLLLLTLPHPK